MKNILKEIMMFYLCHSLSSLFPFATNVNAFLLAADITCSGADGQAVVPEARPHVPHGADHAWTPCLI